MTRLSLVLFALLAQSPLFVAAPPVTVGPGSGQIVFADLNLDRRVDMLTRHLLQRRIGVWLGNGAGGFSATQGTPIALDYQPGGIAAGDVNGDGTPDLAVTKSERNEVEVYLGDGKGGFTRGAGSPFADGPSSEFFTRSVDLLDVNEDGRLDIVTTNGRENTFSILRGNGRGGFAPGTPVKRPARADTRYTFAFGDVNGDGHIDALISGRAGDETSEPARIVILRGDGSGAFQDAARSFAVPASPQWMTLADVNGDRRPDLVITHSHTPSMSVLLNNGGGSFALAPGSPVAIDEESFGVVVADANGDGNPDLLAGTAASATVLLGDGRGRFAQAAGSPFRAGPGAYRISAADINGDGKLDVAAPSFEGNTVTVWLGR
jgi:hypothetical protein